MIVQSMGHRAGGRQYESGTVSPIEAWTDDPPSPVLRRSTQTPSRELRGSSVWAADPQWGPSYPDDVVADAWAFSSAALARRFYEQAARAHCRGSASSE